MKEAITTLELAERWGISHRTLERWRCQKKGPRYIKGKENNSKIIYRIKDIIDYENRYMVATKEQG